MSADLIRELRDALQSAMDGLAWYRDRYPEAVDGSDDEAEAEHAAAIAAADARLAQPVQAVAPTLLQLWCDTCEGTGTVHQESQRGVPGSGCTFDCPDCDGKGYVESRRFVLAAAPAAPTTDKKQQC